MCAAHSALSSRMCEALYPLPGRTLRSIYLYLGGEIFSGRWSRYFITPLRARWWSLSGFMGCSQRLFSALSIKRDKASSKLISDSGQNRISGIIQSTFYTHYGLSLTQRAPVAGAAATLWCPLLMPPTLICLPLMFIGGRRENRLVSQMHASNRFIQTPTTSSFKSHFHTRHLKGGFLLSE